LLAPAAQATPLSDAITATGATTGKVISVASSNVASLTAAQKTALGNLVTALGASWPGNPGHVININFYRVGDTPNVISAAMTGYIVHNDAATAINQLTSGATSSIIGIVP